MFQCQRCKKQFNRKFNLDRHLTQTKICKDHYYPIDLELSIYLIGELKHRIPEQYLDTILSLVDFILVSYEEDENYRLFDMMWNLCLRIPADKIAFVGPLFLKKPKCREITIEFLQKQIQEGKRYIHDSLLFSDLLLVITGT